MGQKHSTSRDNKSLTLPARIVVSTKQPENVSTPPARSGGDQSDLTSIVSAKAIDWSTIDPENRRAYHNLETSIYMLPDEESEQKRLMIQNRVLALAFGGHIVVPEIRQFPNKARIILDVGCASGIWMESLFFGGNLHSRFHGVDITLNPSDFGTVCGAEIASGDVTQTLPYPDSKFDYVHQRALVAGVPKEKWPHVIRELIRVTKSGGWIELVECDASFKSVGENAKFFSEKMEFALSARGVDTNLVNNLPDYVLACPNLINFGHKVVKIPVGWGGEIGELSAQDARSGLVHLGDFLKKSLGVDEEEYLKMVGAAAAEWSKTQAYGEWVGVWAQVMK